jgi:hypothetical protein
MKTVIKSLCMTGTVCSLLLLSSCDDKDEKLPNQIIINTKTYPLAHGYYSDDGIDTDMNGKSGRYFTIALTSSNLTISSLGIPVGKGNMVVLELFSPSTSTLSSGTYSADSYLVGTGTFVFVEQLVNNWERYEKFYIAHEGYVKVSQSGSTYKLEFNFVLATFTGDDVKATGSFEGVLTRIAN